MAEKRQGSAGRAIAVGVLTLVVIPIALSATGLLDLRIPWPWLSGSSHSERRQVLSPDSPVVVTWTGVADTIEISWTAQDSPELDHYSVDVYALAPVESWYNVGYRFGEELRTSAIANPVAELDEDLHEQGRPERVAADQVWRICVTGMRETPGGVDITPYIIEGTERCSDPFTIPSSAE